MSTPRLMALAGLMVGVAACSGSRQDEGDLALAQCATVVIGPGDTSWVNTAGDTVWQSQAGDTIPKPRCIWLKKVDTIPKP